VKTLYQDLVVNAGMNRLTDGLKFVLTIDLGRPPPPHTHTHTSNSHHYLQNSTNTHTHTHIHTPPRTHTHTHTPPHAHGGKSGRPTQGRILEHQSRAQRNNKVRATEGQVTFRAKCSVEFVPSRLAGVPISCPSGSVQSR